MNIHSYYFGSQDMLKLSRKQATIRREQTILNAALEIFARKGFTAATIPEIAAKAGIAVGTIYNYYPNKRELFIAVIKHQIITPLEDIINTKISTDFKSMLMDLIKNRLDLADNNIVMKLLPLVSEILRDPELSGVFREKLVKPLMSSMEDVYRKKILSGEISPVEPEVAARAVGGFIVGIIILKTVEGGKGPLENIPQEKLAGELLRFILYGLAGKGKQATI